MGWLLRLYLDNPNRCQHGKRVHLYPLFKFKTMNIYNLKGKLLAGLIPLKKQTILGKEYISFENGIAMKCNPNLLIPFPHYREITSEFISSILKSNI